MQEINLHVGPAIALSTAERTLAKLAGVELEGSSVLLDLRECRVVHTFAGSYFGNGLRMCRGGGGLTVLVPTPESDKFPGSWFQSFTRTGLGRALANNADRILCSEGDITGMVRQYYSQHELLEGDMLLEVADFHTNRLLATHNADAFLRQFKIWLAGRRIPGLEDAHDESQIQDVARFCFQAAQNVVDHASYLVGGDTTAVRSRFSVSFYKRAAAGRKVGSLASYLDVTRAGPETIGYVAIEIVDDGVGVASRQGQDPDVYRGAIEVEDQALVEALRTGGTIKTELLESIWSGDPGYGFFHIQDSLASLGAYGSVRTGRRLVEFFDGGRGFVVDPRQFCYIPGTAISVLLPVLAPQMRLFED